MSIKEVYDYSDEQGRLIFQTVRKEPKGFYQRRKGPSGEWIYSLDELTDEQKHVLYGLPAVIKALSGGVPIYFPEGEKDCLTLQALGFTATTNAGGAGKMTAEHVACFKRFENAKAVVFADNDKPGREHAQEVAALLYECGCVIKVIDFSELPEKGGDVSDWLSSGHTKQDLIERIKTTPRWSPPGEVQAEVETETESPDEADAVPWPQPMEQEAFHGLAGDIVRAISPHSEADEAAILMNFLIGFGSMIGRGPWIHAGGVRHGTNLFGVLVGGTSKGRKGTSWGPVEALFKQVDEVWTKDKTPGGLSSGEGLIWVIHDEIRKVRKGRKDTEQEFDPIADTEVDVPGIDDKRLCVIESELGQTLQVLRREGNTLSPILRQAWDGRDVLQSLTKATKAKATNAHISIIGHVTKAELTENFSAVEILNGLGNRILWCCVRRSKLLPNGGRVPEHEMQILADRISTAVEYARVGPEVRKAASIEESWADAYAVLSEGRTGLWGAATARAEAQVLRIAMVYALLDCTDTIRREHLDAALAVWGYCEDSAAFIWADETGDPAMDKILELLEREPRTQTEINDSVRLSAKVLRQKLQELSGRGKIRFEESQQEKGRKKKTWYLCR